MDMVDVGEMCDFSEVEKLMLVDALP